MPCGSYGSALNDLKRYEEAIAAFDQAIRLNPNDATFYYGKGIALNDLNRYEEAKQVFEKAHQLSLEASRKRI
jgi:Flp pilus assembly protein TadD